MRLYFPAAGRSLLVTGRGYVRDVSSRLRSDWPRHVLRRIRTLCSLTAPQTKDSHTHTQSPHCVPRVVVPRFPIVVRMRGDIEITKRLTAVWRRSPMSDQVRPAADAGQRLSLCWWSEIGYTSWSKSYNFNVLAINFLCDICTFPSFV